MNIKRAKEEIKHTIRAYLSRDNTGNYRIPSIRQRPLLLIGPPGVGKTQIVAQAAEECGVGLVSYTITHHTRQTAVGLPVIKEAVYGGETRSVTGYTMSEILASVWERIESGEKEGILFIDEINCVSETLAPTMLQFLQCKTFGNQPLPEGWLIIAAGNPPEYNKSVRDFDIVTLDRVRRMDIEADLTVWKEYARQHGLFPALLSYLELRPQNFYKIIPDVDGTQFVTARGWEDLSELLYVYQQLELPTDWELVYQFLQHEEVARDVAAYLELYRKYSDAYGVDEILAGRIRPGVYARAMDAAFDERLSLVSLIGSGLAVRFAAARDAEAVTERCYAFLKSFHAASAEGTPAQLWQKMLDEQTASVQLEGQHQLLPDKRKDGILAEVNRLLSEWTPMSADFETAFEQARAGFAAQAEHTEQLSETASQALEYAFDFIENAFGEGQEMVVFVTELTVGPDSAPFIADNGCERYYRYNQSLLVGSRRAALRQQLEQDVIRGDEHSREF